MFRLGTEERLSDAPLYLAPSHLHGNGPSLATGPERLRRAGVLDSDRQGRSGLLSEPQKELPGVQCANGVQSERRFVLRLPESGNM